MRAENNDEDQNSYRNLIDILRYLGRYHAWMVKILLNRFDSHPETEIQSRNAIEFRRNNL